MSDLDQLHEVGQLLRAPAFDDLVDISRRRTWHARIATAATLAVAATAVVVALAVTGHNPRTAPPIAPAPSPTPTERLNVPVGQQTIVPHVQPSDVAGFEVLATVTNSQPEHRGDSGLSMTLPDATLFMSEYCRGPSDLYWFIDIGDGGGGFGRCSPDAETSFDPGDIAEQRNYEPSSNGLRTVRIWIGRPSPTYIKCQHSDSSVCSDLHDVPPVANPDAEFGMQFYKDPVRPVLQLLGKDAANNEGYALGALSSIKGVAWLLDRAVVAADDADRLAFQLATSDTDYLVDVYTEDGPHKERCIAQHEHELPDWESTDHNVYEAALDKLCGVDLRLVVDGTPIAPDEVDSETTGHFSDLGARLSSGAEHQVEVKVARGDPRNIRYGVVVRTRTHMP